MFAKVGKGRLERAKKQYELNQLDNAIMKILRALVSAEENTVFELLRLSGTSVSLGDFSSNGITCGLRVTGNGLVKVSTPLGKEEVIEKVSSFSSNRLNEFSFQLATDGMDPQVMEKKYNDGVRNIINIVLKDE